MAISFRISDETLRDGEQQVGVVFSLDQKEELAHDIARAGIDYIALMPAAGEPELTTRLRRDGLPIVPDVPAKVEYVDQARRTGSSRIVLFAAASDTLLATRGITRAENLAHCVELARYAFDSGMVVDFAVEDASRSDVDYVVALATAVDPFAEHLILCDTVGCLQPSMTAIWVKEIVERTGMPIGIHCHNDLGMAVENTICAVLAGATLVSSTFTGIGERAGLAATEQVLLRLREEHGIVHRGVDYGALEGVARKVRLFAGRGPANPLSQEAFQTESGMYVHAMLHDPGAYSIFPSAEPQVWFGKYSGASNFRWLFERKLGMPQSDETYERMREMVKDLACERKTSFSADEVMKMYEERIFQLEEMES